MSKTWYPIIDYDKCTGCLVCYDKCSHGVYELNSRDFPKVVFPEGCVHGCTGCGSICPSEAITYLGAETVQKSESCCGDDSSSDCCGGNDSGCGCGDDSSQGCCGESDKQEEKGGCGCGCC